MERQGRAGGSNGPGRQTKSEASTGDGGADEVGRFLIIVSRLGGGSAELTGARQEVKVGIDRVGMPFIFFS